MEYSKMDNTSFHYFSTALLWFNQFIGCRNMVEGSARPDIFLFNGI